MTSPYNPDPFEIASTEVGQLAADYMTYLNDSPVVHKQLASGVAVHFGSESLFIPSNDPRLARRSARPTPSSTSTSVRSRSASVASRSPSPRSPAGRVTTG